LIDCSPGQLSDFLFERVKTVFDENSLVAVPCPPDSPDLPPSDFWLFGHINASLARREFNDISPLNCILFSPLDRASEMDLSQQWRLLSPVNNMS
jgi:hypothetical protein